MNLSVQLSVVIVNYKNPHLIRQCVQSIVDMERDFPYEIVVVDNDSQDDSEIIIKNICPDLIWIQMGYNSGFAKANNVGVKAARGKYILYLNSDTRLIEPVFKEMIKQLDSEKSVGIVGCKMVNNQLELQHSYHNSDCFFRKLWWRNPLAIKMFNVTSRINKYNDNLIKKHCENNYVPWISGAIMLTKRDYVLKNDLFWDEDFFMYWEDVDLCYRFIKKGFKIKYLYSPSIVHIGGGGENIVIARFEQSEMAKWQFIRKHHGRLYSFVYRRLLMLELRMEYELEKRKKSDSHGILEKEFAYYGIIKK